MGLSVLSFKCRVSANSAPPLQRHNVPCSWAFDKYVICKDDPRARFVLDYDLIKYATERNRWFHFAAEMNELFDHMVEGTVVELFHNDGVGRKDLRAWFHNEAERRGWPHITLRPTSKYNFFRMRMFRPEKGAPDPLRKMPVEMDPPKVLLSPAPHGIPLPEKLWALWSPSNPNGRPHGTYSSSCSDAPTSLTPEIINSRFENTPATYGPPKKTITEQYEEEKTRLMNEKMRSKQKRRDERRKKAKTDMDTDKENNSSSDEDDEGRAQKITMKAMKAMKAMEAATPARRRCEE